ncbi:Uridine nucleosidase 1 [Coemansia biformis]|uniref:Uridine nucleosidase 1 n=1 Tax=Coemansia biformis TaxID=1286918 RepID=A0A9W7YDL0_9FUNG|nr:Uridine nucleosidase 1 [Coemansia biformis]
MSDQADTLNAAPGTRIPVWLDCDVGHDDAMALILGAYHPDIRLLGVSSVSGNAPVEKTTENAIRVIQAAGIAGVKVYKGAAKPLVKQVRHHTKVHGASGLDGTDLLPRADYEQYFCADTNAVNAMYAAIMGSSGPVALVAVGPLTNVGLLLSVYPEVATRIRTLAIMGGIVNMGSNMPSSEFNISSDPEAAHIVFGAGIEHVALVPLNVTLTVLASHTIIERINSAVPNPRFAKLITDLLGFSASTHAHALGKDAGAPLHDPVAMAYLVMRGAFTEKHVRVDVDCVNGKLQCDMQSAQGLPANCWVATSVESSRFWTAMMDAYAQASARCRLAE